MVDKVGLCNAALALLGDDKIDALTDTTDRAKLCSRLYDPTRDAVLRAHLWKCCKKRAVLSPAIDAPAFEWAYQFLIPADCIRVISIDQEGYITPFKIEGRYILANTNVANCRYIFNNDDPTSYSGGLVDVMVYALAKALAYPITHSAAMRDSIGTEYTRALVQARAADGQEDYAETWNQGPVKTARYFS